MNSYKKPKIIVIGSTYTELIIDVPRLPKKSETIISKNLQIIPGGGGANIAAAATRLGGKVFFVACVGIDPFGVRILTDLAKEKINLDFIERTKEVYTGITHTFIDSDGNKLKIYFPGSNQHFSLKAVHSVKAMLSSADILILQLDIPLESVELAIRAAHRYKVPVLLNPTPAENCNRKIVSLSDILVANKIEAQIILKRQFRGIDDVINGVKLLLGLGVGAAVITLGKEGCVVCMEPSNPVYIPAHFVDTVDTSGVGDVFTAAISIALSNGKNLFESVCYANAAAALSTARTGGFETFPTTEEVENFTKLPLSE